MVASAFIAIWFVMDLVQFIDWAYSTLQEARRTAGFLVGH
jgi:hypothetical protein